MMHYRKGENIEKQLTKEELPFGDFLPKGTDFLWMHVNGGTKVNNVITYAKNALDKGEHKSIVWSGNGGGVVKTISCAEIIKRSYPLYQVTRMCYTTVEEHWKPQTEGLDDIVANRQVPSLHIYMSLEPIDDSVSGLQKPNSKTDFWVYNDNNSNSHNSHSGGAPGLSNSSRNQRQRNGNQGQRRPPRQQRPPNTLNAGVDQLLQPVARNERNLEANQQNMSKKRKPRPNQNRGPSTTVTTNKADGNEHQVEPMEP